MHNKLRKDQEEYIALETRKIKKLSLRIMELNKILSMELLAGIDAHAFDSEAHSSKSNALLKRAKALCLRSQKLKEKVDQMRKDSISIIKEPDMFKKNDDEPSLFQKTLIKLLDGQAEKFKEDLILGKTISENDRKIRKWLKLMLKHNNLNTPGNPVSVELKAELPIFLKQHCQ